MQPESTHTPSEDEDKLSQQVKSLQNQVQASARVLCEIQQPTPSRKRTAKVYVFLKIIYIQVYTPLIFVVGVH